MVRRNLILWIGLGVFAVLVAALAVTALNREAGEALHGRWMFSFVETPEGTFGSASRGEWIEFDEQTFHGQTDCFDFDGEFTSSQPGEFLLNGHGWGGGCEVFEGVSYAFDQYFGLVSLYEFGPGGLTLESSDASVQFVFISEGE